jgi:hypothetical protein
MATRGRRRRQKRRAERKSAGNVEVQNYGGSEAKTNEYRGKFSDAADRGETRANAGVDRANDGARTADRGLAESGATAKALLNRNVDAGERAGQGFNQAIGNYDSGRGAILGNAGQLEADAATAAQDYKQTSDAAFRLNQDRNTRAALATAAGRGAAGLRTALATSVQGNADAASQQQIIQAQELNAIRQQKADALATAAGIRAGVGAQDQNAAGIYSNRQQTNDANAIGLNGQGANVAVSRAGVQQAAANLGAQVGTSQQGLSTGALTGLEETQLGSAQQAATGTAANQAAKQDRRIRMFTDPFVGFNRSN